MVEQRPSVDPAASARVLLDALALFEAAAGAVHPDQAVPVVREAVANLDDDQVRAVAVALAVESVWRAPRGVSPAGKATADELRQRLAVWRGWIRRQRLEAWWVAS